MAIASLRPADFRSAGPLRLLRGHLPLKGEDCENADVLPLQGEVGAQRPEEAHQSALHHEVLPLQTEVGAQRPEGAHQKPLHHEVLPLQGPSGGGAERSEAEGALPRRPWLRGPRRLCRSGPGSAVEGAQVDHVYRTPDMGF